MSLSYLDLGDPTVKPIGVLQVGALIPDHVNAPNGTLLFINQSAATLRVIMPANKIFMRIPSGRAVRKLTLAVPEPAGFQWQVDAIDGTYIGSNDVLIELYAPDECVPPFEQAAPFGTGGSGVGNALALVQGSTIAGTPANYLFPDTTFVSVVAPVTGAYVGYSSLYVRDANTTPGDKLQPAWTNWGASAPAFAPPTYERAAVFYTAGSQFGGNVQPFNQIAFYIPATKGDLITWDISITGTGSGPQWGYAFIPTVEIWAALCLVAIQKS